MTRFSSESIKLIAIVGAGPSGLAAAKYLLAENAFLRIVLYEQKTSLGGTWNFTPLPSNGHKYGAGNLNQGSTGNARDVVTANITKFNTPMYEGLESNLPHMLMQFSDAPFPSGTQLFAKRETVQDYLEDYAKEIVSMIRFSHQVVEIKPTNGDEPHEREVTTKDVGTGVDNMERFDAVIVANGHSAQPLLPNIKGLDHWSRQSPESIYHSVSYKNNAAFENKRVLLVGGGPSGADISRQIAAVCKHPLLVAQTEKSPYYVDEPDTRDHPALVELMPDDRAASFEDGSVERDIDVLLLCTGYAHSFPFLNPIDPAIKKQGIKALPLYQYIFHMEHPTLAFVEMPEKIVPFPLAESQAAIIARVWSGRLTLPSQSDMQAWWEGIARERGSGKGFHALTPPSDLEYMKDMYDWCLEGKDRASTDNDARGKIPRRWDEKACWLRMEAAEMKKAFNKKGEERHKVLKYEDLGFQFNENRR